MRLMDGEDKKILSLLAPLRILAWSLMRVQIGLTAHLSVDWWMCS